MIVDDGKSSRYYNFQLLYYFVVKCNMVFLEINMCLKLAQDLFLLFSSLPTPPQIIISRDIQQVGHGICASVALLYI